MKKVQEDVQSRLSAAVAYSEVASGILEEHVLWFYSRNKTSGRTEWKHVQVCGSKNIWPCSCRELDTMTF